MFANGIKSENSRIYVDVAGLNTVTLQLYNDFNRPDNSYNSAVGIYFEDADGNIITNSAKCLYTNTLQQWEHESIELLVPQNATALLYWLLPNGASYRSFSREDVFNIQLDGYVPQLIDVDNNNTIVMSESYANMVHLSNPAYNHDNAIWMVLDNDGQVYMEDVDIGSQKDISIVWTKSIMRCDIFCSHREIENVAVPTPTIEQQQDIYRIIPDGNTIVDPVYISEASSPVMTLSSAGELWVTFVLEGAGYKNKFGYAIVDNEKVLAGLPKADCIIKQVTIWENASALNSGGDLVNGDTVSLGWFSEGTTIVWWLQADGYNRPNNHTWWSIDAWNGDGFRHVAIGADPYSGKVVVGFEDLWSLGDKDYNDIVFYVTGHPIYTIDYTKIHVGDPSTDTTNVPVTWEESVINFDGEGQLTFNEELYEKRIKGNNGWGNGDQPAPGNSLENNNAENAQ